MNLLYNHSRLNPMNNLSKFGLHTVIFLVFANVSLSFGQAQPASEPASLPRYMLPPAKLAEAMSEGKFPEKRDLLTNQLQTQFDKILDRLLLATQLRQADFEKVGWPAMYYTREFTKAIENAKGSLNAAEASKHLAAAEGNLWALDRTVKPPLGMASTLPTRSLSNEEVLLLTFGNPLGVPMKFYQTREEAAKAALASLIPISNRKGRELGVKIYQTPFGFIYIGPYEGVPDTRPMTKDRLLLVMPGLGPPLAQAVADGHTHTPAPFDPRFPKRHDISPEFPSSDFDLATAAQKNQPGFLGTPSGAVREYYPNGTVMTIAPGNLTLEGHYDRAYELYRYIKGRFEAGRPLRRSDPQDAPYIQEFLRYSEEK